MEHLLVRHAEPIEFFRMGVYWCCVDYAGPESLHPLVRNFATAISTNFQVVPITGFDEMMEAFWNLAERSGSDIARPVASRPDSEPEDLEMRKQPGAKLSDLDLHAARARLSTYCTRFDISLPPRLSNDDLRDLLIRLDMALQTPDAVVPTRAGYLLFGNKPQQLLPSALVQLTSNGESRAIGGNLWNQLDAVSDALAELIGLSV